jgi:hypothetical protein
MSKAQLLSSSRWLRMFESKPRAISFVLHACCNGSNADGDRGSLQLSASMVRSEIDA